MFLVVKTHTAQPRENINDLRNEVVSNKSFGNKSGSQSWTELIHEIGGLIQAKY